MAELGLTPFVRATQQIYTLARAKDLDGTSWKATKAAILEAADALRTVTGQTEAPIQLEPILLYRNIYRTWFSSDSSPEATLAPRRDGFTLRLRPGLSAARSRFSQAHEVAHTFFYDIGKAPPEKLLHLSPRTKAYRKQEDICNAFASVLLLPGDLVRQFLLKCEAQGLSKWDISASLSTDFHVSMETAIRRLLSGFPMFEHSAAIFVDEVRESRSCRRWFGRALSSPRVAELELLQSLGDAIANAPKGHLEEEIRRIAEPSKGTAEVKWKLVSSGSGSRFIAILLDFDISRRLTK